MRGYDLCMNLKQELDAAVKELELARAGLKSAGGELSTQKRGQMESKARWLEDKVEKLRKKQQS